MAGQTHHRYGNYERLRLVAGSPDKLEWKSSRKYYDRCTDYHRCVRFGMGRTCQWSESNGILEHKDVPRALKLSRTDGSHDGYSVFSLSTERTHSPTPVGQHNNNSLPEQFRRLREKALGASYGDMVRMLPHGYSALCQTSGRKGKLSSGSVIQNEYEVRLDASPETVSSHRQIVWSTRRRQVCVNDDNTTTDIQQPHPRSVYSGGRCFSTKRLDSYEQLRKCTILLNSESAGCDREPGSGSYSHSPILASSDLVQASEKIGDSPSVNIANVSTDHLVSESFSGASAKPEVENRCLADLWQAKAKSLGWSDRAAKQLIFAWAPSTLQLYDRMSSKFIAICHDKNPLYATHCDVAKFLCIIADSSDRPASQLKNAIAALNNLYGALDIQSPAHHPDIGRLSCALTKSATIKPASRTAIMPLKPFYDMFCSWSDNQELPLDKLRLKAVTLMAITFMARPSDLAPMGMTFDPITMCTKNQVLSTNNIVFNDDGSMCVRFFGTKNDSTRTGFEVNVPKAKDHKVDPVNCVKVYIDRTCRVRPIDDAPLFIALKSPYKAINSSSIARILGNAIQLAGLDNHIFSAKNFRPSAATAAVNSDVSADTAMQLGRWKTKEVFLNHYVYPRAPDDYTQNLVSGKND